MVCERSCRWFRQAVNRFIEGSLWRIAVLLGVQSRDSPCVVNPLDCASPLLTTAGNVGLSSVGRTDDQIKNCPGDNESREADIRRQQRRG